MLKRLNIVLWLLVVPLFVLAQGNAHQKYIDKYKDLAISQMKKYGIPASITLAQGLLESDAGRSMLAVEGNNHFGIKCHSDWTGKKMYHDDDRRDDCFRVYRNVEGSFEDHSLFLTTHSRYAFLFDLKPTDYVGWARGLKKAGYATNPAYAEKLIEIIERYNLDMYDKGGKFKKENAAVGFAHQPYISNSLLYIRMGEGESLKEIAKEFDMTRMRLRRYNEINREYVPEPGSVIYLERKKGKADKQYQLHTVQSGESLWTISQ
ncbi:MAG: glucosaminidase domain-containing protein, partial [Bacteroidaceae bacterium]|nr:glucosaminidase domain-containing protein [Bacteroidaceae bacterium]